VFDASGYTQTPYKHRWWFLEDGYRGLTVSKVASIATSPSDLQSLGRFFLYRHPAEGHTGSVDAVALIPLALSQYDTARPSEAPAVKAQRLPDGRLVIGKSGVGPGELQQPADVFVDKTGTIWVADGKNNRINRYDAQGNFLGALGPFAAAPAALDEPWSVAVDETGVIYVADTWHHRIVKFSPSLQYMTSWGEPATKPNPGPLELFGPRDIAFGEDGTLWVTDTGSNRLINFTRNGEPIAVFGQAGSAPGEFAEPVSLARDGAGRVYVADAWNGRILRFQRGMVAPEVFPTGWTSHEVIAKPYLAVLFDGRIIATDPGHGTLILLDTSGAKIGTWRPSDGATPIGVAAMPDGGFVFSDGTPGREQLQVVPGALIPSLFK
jgi:DNA-binding beta-propeller fold protein YncE